ncbi:MAG: flagellar biosynthesis protein FlhB [Negativicutes bacterium]|nr:flagellar biosynthesis protein FlhB [Negativicutes bacterium]
MACTKTFTASLQPLSANTAEPFHLHTFDLQLFNQEKTEEATPKRRDEARKKGQVARSLELNSALVILTAFFTLKIVGPYTYQELTGLFHFIYDSHFSAEFSVNFVYALFLTLSLVFFKTALPVMLAIVIVSLVSNVLQVGFYFTLEPMLPRFERIDPIAGFSRLFSKRSLVELLKSICKVAIIGYFIYRFILKEVLDLPKLISADLADSFAAVASLTLDLALQIGAVMLVLAGLDYFYQRWEHNQSLKMSKQEIKEEYKQTEGNPQIKGKIKERQRAMAMRRMMQEVPKADVIITNPTHFAVALRYETGMAAPTLIAKGQDLVAQRIKDIAQENRVTIVENKPLARALYATVDIGGQVPPELYQAVAEVLAYVYRLKKRLS